MNIYDWKTILSQPFDQFTDEQLEALAIKSHSWQSCAVADLDIPKDEKDIPLDKEFLTLGTDFNNKGVAWMCEYIKSYRKTSDTEFTNVGGISFSVKATRLELAEKYRRKSLKIIDKILEAIENLPCDHPFEDFVQKETGAYCSRCGQDLA